ncbi:MAG TPA: 2-dehydropantoate 2-reductase N-terminal domain-containing protein [Mycobacterium sp.]|nr:2-dehydropantoate 2-reductase N-terminal domain-containing protein [Mycobacterium sp.]
MRVLVVGAGVIGSVYAGRLLEAGHTVTLCARGERLDALREHGLILAEEVTHRRTQHEVAVVSTPEPGVAYDLVLVAVRRDQMMGTVPMLASVDANVMFFGNAAGLTAQLANAAGRRTLLGFPGVGGITDGVTVRFVQIRQQKTMVADTDHRETARVKALAAMFRTARFPTQFSADAEGWLIAHAALVVPLAMALLRVDVQPRRLAADRALLTTVVRATREAFRALQAAGNSEIPRNLLALYLLMPEWFGVRYWRTMMNGRAGELCFAGHTRAAPEEMTSLARVLRSAIDRSGRRAPDLESLLQPGPV